jgi:hypothetical protein
MGIVSNINHHPMASSRWSLEKDIRRGKPVSVSISVYVQGILTHEPFASARHIAEKPEQPRSATLKCLREELGLCKIQFR